jgi:hypothetical protein
MRAAYLIIMFNYTDGVTQRNKILNLIVHIL